jgi:hypothetical protein
MMQKKTPGVLRVLPNPYFVLDAQGMPAGAVRWDPEVGRPGTIHYVGCEVTRSVIPDKEMVGERGYESNVQRSARERRRKVSFRWSWEPVTIPASAAHKEAVRIGTLLAADKATARECRVWFVPPQRALADARQKAIDEWYAANGERLPVSTWADAVGLPVAA